ncbi:MAG: aspartate carbamoyltransferase catalytic subunit [Steroidobacteraceae bacterium]
MIEQLDSRGGLHHLITLEGLPRALVGQLLDSAQRYVVEPGARYGSFDRLRGFTVANLFTEPSTRTRVSFELAAKRLGAEVVNLEVQLSSRVKGESMLDTIYTLEALNVDVLVMRDSEANVPDLVAANVSAHVSVLSGGAGSAAHPTQGLLDALTIRQRKPQFERLRVVIVGDLRHSRVARSAFHALGIMGTTDIRIVAPEALMPDDSEFAGCERFVDFDAGIADADVIMMLRIQKERMAQAQMPDADRYFAEYGLDQRRLALARADAMVMHPQPMNRGIEISSEVADGAQSAIRAQVQNGIAVRMAVLDAVTAAARGER